MRYFLGKNAALKLLEEPCAYNMLTDELYELDAESFAYLRSCASDEGCSSGNAEFISYCIKEGILDDHPGPAKRPPIEQAPTPSLRYLELQITDRCNLRCAHCFVGDSKGREMSLEEVRRVLSEFERMQGLRLLITGGEPALHREFAAINGMLPEFHFRKVLFSNGIALTDKLLRALNVHEIQISIDGMRSAHDSIRGAGAYEKAMDAAQRSIAMGIATSISTMVHPANVDDFEEMDTLFKKMGVRDWSVDVPCSYGRMSEHPEISISPEVGGRLLQYGFGEGLHGGAGGYACGVHLMSVMADGKAAKCSFYADDAVGHISEGLRQCWGRIRPIKLSELECDCAMVEACRGGCRFRAAQLGGPLGRDLFKCASMGYKPSK